MPPLECGARECSGHSAPRAASLSGNSKLSRDFASRKHSNLHGYLIVVSVPPVMASQCLHRALRAPSVATLVAFESALSGLKISPSAPFDGRRYASHATQGRANGAKDGAGKRLGAKKTAGEYVIPGNILFKQRGTLWFPGDGCFMA